MCREGRRLAIDLPHGRPHAAVGRAGMRLVTDRFIVTANGDVFDAATAGQVRLRHLSHASESSEIAWEQRCAERFELGFRATRPLLDYGVDASGQRFEVTTGRASPRAASTAASGSEPAQVAACREIRDLLDTGSRAGPGRVLIQTTSAAALEEVLRRLARLSRLRGFVPVSYTALNRWCWLRPLLLHRHVLAIAGDGADRCEPAGPVRLLLGLGLSSARPHLVVATRVRPDLAGLAREVEVGGLPAGGLHDRNVDGSIATVVVREEPGGFGAVASDRASRDMPARRIREIHVRVRRGVDAAARGRRAVGLRLLRSAAGALARRGEHAAAAEASQSLGSLLMEAGEVEKAIASFEAARAAADEAECPASAVRAVVNIGLARTDAGRLADAESALRSAQVAAGTLRSSCLALRADNALARCLLWQGRHAEAHDLLRSVEDGSGRQMVIKTLLRARVALARRDLVAAGRLAAAALRMAEERADARERASAHAIVATTASYAGDRAGLREHVARGLHAARAAHSPVRLWRLRATLLEGLTRVGDHEARRVAARLARSSRSPLPALLRGRVERALLAALPDAIAAADWRAHLRALVRVHGVRALELSRIEVPRMDVIEELIEVLGICQEGDEEPATLTSVCGAVRERLGALSVSVHAGPPINQRLACDGRVRSGPSDIGARITDTGLVIPPTRSPQGGLEAGAPVRYAGGVVAALTCHWGSDQTPDPSRVGALLATAAAACAPRVRTALDRLVVPERPADGHPCGLIGVSQTVNDVRGAVARAAGAPFPVLIEGESGSGKELVARAVHRGGPRREGRFAALNCAALNDELIEAELFGHTRGAFSGAVHERVGLFEEADGGSLFLDEVSELSPRAQAKLLRAIQEGEVRRVGENVTRRVDVRLIAATNRDLAADVAAGRFRQDLRYRLDVVRIAVPPLRARVEDIAVLAQHFWGEATRRTGSRATLTPEVLATLSRYDWPGNVRELQNVMAALAVAAPARGRVGPQWLPRPMAQAAGAGCAGTLEEARRTFERRYVRAALAREGGHRGRTAAALGLSRQGFAKALARLDIQTP